MNSGAKLASVSPAVAGASASWAWSLIRAVRVHQWPKNLLVFVPVLLHHDLADPGAWQAGLLAFAAFSLCASSVYVTNDLLDLQADRQHPEKCRRPFASGVLKPVTGLVLAPLFLTASVTLAWTLASDFLSVLLAYFVVTVLYSVILKTKLLADVITLAALYTIRIFAGGTATGIPISQWTLAFSMFLFLSLALSKRVSELKSAEQQSRTLSRRSYLGTDLLQLSCLGTASGYIAILVFALYLNSPEVRQQYHRPDLLWLACPVLAYWVSRLWVLTNRGDVSEDPVLFALKDKASYVAGAAVLAVLLSASQSW